MNWTWIDPATKIIDTNFHELDINYIDQARMKKNFGINKEQIAKEVAFGEGFFLVAYGEKSNKSIQIFQIFFLLANVEFPRIEHE